MVSTGGDSADDGFEIVYVELDWYDGPQAGVAAVEGAPHYFQCVHDQPPGADQDDEFLVWPIDPQAFAWEREQWALFVEWDTRQRAGTASADSHPGSGGVDARYDELTDLLAPHRIAPDGARRFRAEFRGLPRVERYHTDGPDYALKWHRLTGR